MPQHTEHDLLFHRFSSLHGSAVRNRIGRLWNYRHSWVFVLVPVQSSDQLSTNIRRFFRLPLDPLSYCGTSFSGPSFVYAVLRDLAFRLFDCLARYISNSANPNPQAECWSHQRLFENVFYVGCSDFKPDSRVLDRAVRGRRFVFNGSPLHLNDVLFCQTGRASIGTQKANLAKGCLTHSSPAPGSPISPAILYFSLAQFPRSL